MINELTEIKFDDNSKLPIYKQLCFHIESLIISGKLKPGERLPTERVLEEITGISRGTIKSAYKELQKNERIKTIQGNGSFVMEYSHDEAKKFAVGYIAKMMNQMQIFNISLPEIEEIFNKELEIRYESNRRVKVAWVDCSIECLSTISEQLESMKSICLTTYLLDDIINNPDKLSKDYDLIVTTSKHFDTLSPLLPDKLSIMEKVTLDPKMDTVIEIVKIPAGKKVALWSISHTFVPIMHEILANFDNIGEVSDFVGEDNLEAIQKRLANFDVLLIPPAYIGLKKEGMIRTVNEFEKRGGKTVMFEYQLNKGSLIHFEDRIKAIFKLKNK